MAKSSNPSLSSQMEASFLDCNSLSKKAVGSLAGRVLTTLHQLCSAMSTLRQHINMDSSVLSSRTVSSNVTSLFPVLSITVIM